MRFQVGRRVALQGETVAVPITVSGFSNVTTAQFTLAWNPAVLRYAGAGDYGLSGLSSGNFSAARSQEGLLTCSWNEPGAAGATVADGTVIFTVSFKVTGRAGSFSALRLVDSPTAREASVNLALAAMTSEDGQVRVGGVEGLRVSEPVFREGVFNGRGRGRDDDDDHDIRRDDGATAYSGFGVSDLSRWWPARDDGPGVSTIRNFVDPAWSPTQDAPAGFQSKIMPVLEGRYRWSASPTGLIDFMRAGKKIMVWHGSDDGLGSMADTVRTWQDLVTRAGTPGRENSRLYIPPGVDHCGGGAGADTFDLLTPLMAWVERGTPPATPVARKLGPDGAVLFTRPLCEHPAYPRYRGTGDVNDAGSFACVRP